MPINLPRNNYHCFSCIISVHFNYLFINRVSAYEVFQSLISESIGKVVNCQQRLLLSQNCFSSRSTTRGYTAAVYLCLMGSRDQCGHPSAAEEYRSVSKYPEGKLAFKIRSGACGFVFLARAS
ncbi:hypothetical protein RF11_01466 [Thelohanellus kitauei]|uniref:Uncharacterized protein n=1 Tax=Thelohanellus kitauei TaxID=669202 RepID=A0A0C2MHW0_THEKT|nr:hypothetical protein RF11_01466 [Thelohanellus kitauei]